MRKIKNIYVHIPFCRKKCSFCDFSVYAIGTNKVNTSYFEEYIAENYLKNLINEIEFIGENFQQYFESERFLDSIYFGGGTPTLLSASQLDRVLKVLQRFWKFDKINTEISIESDPNTFDEEKLNFYADLSFNRITMGIQSLDKSIVDKLNRSHTIADVFKSIELIKKSKFHENFGVDLIQGLPSQNIESIKEDLNILLNYTIPHLSVYMLSLETNSKLFNTYKTEYYTDKKQDEIADMFTYTHNILTQAKYDHYEISNFSQRGKYSRHNQSYWDGFSQFYGFGNSASSYAFGKRFKKPKSIRKYYEFIHNLTYKNYFQDYLQENNEYCDYDNSKEDHKVLDLKFLLLNQIRRKEGINLIEIKNNFENNLYNKVKDFFSNGRNFHEIHKYIHNNVDSISLSFPEGILVSDEILVNLFKHLA